MSTIHIYYRLKLDIQPSFQSYPHVSEVFFSFFLFLKVIEKTKKQSKIVKKFDKFWRETEKKQQLHKQKPSQHQ